MITPRLSLVLALSALAVPALALQPGCECDRDEASSEGTAEGEGGEGEGEGEGSEGEGEGGEGEGAERAEPGPIGRTIGVFDDNTVTTRLFLLHRIGDAPTEAPADATVIGAAWVGGVERELSIVSSNDATDRSATLFGPIGTCNTRILRTLELRGTVEGETPTQYGALEVAPCEGSSVESIETTHPFGVESEAAVEQLIGASMTPATPELGAIVAEAETEAGDGEEMDLQTHAVGDTGASVLQGWSTYVVREGRVIATFEDGVPAYVTIGAQIDLVVRSGREIHLYAVRGGALERLAIESPLPEPASDAAGEPAAPEVEETDEATEEAEPTP